MYRTTQTRYQREATITAFLLAAGALALTVFAAVNAFDLPVVDASWPEKACVRVHSNDPAHSCSNLPSRYEVRYVAPISRNPTTYLM